LQSGQTLDADHVTGQVNYQKVIGGIGASFDTPEHDVQVAQKRD
jgi:hypothetical protein